MSDESMLKGLNVPFEAGTVRIFTGGEAGIELFPNGDIHVNGKLAANDQEVVDGLRLFLSRIRRQEGVYERETETLMVALKEVGWDADGEESAEDFVKRLARIAAKRLVPEWSLRDKQVGGKEEEENG